MKQLKLMHEAGRSIAAVSSILADFSPSVYSDVPLVSRDEPSLAGLSVRTEISEFPVPSHGDLLSG